MTLFKKWYYKVRYWLTGKLPKHVEYSIEIWADAFHVRSAANVLAWNERYRGLYELGLLQATVRWPLVKTIVGEDAVVFLTKLSSSFLLSADVTYFVHGREVRLESVTDTEDVTKVIAKGTYELQPDELKSIMTIPQ